MENRWIENRIEQREPEIRLFCLPHSGGGASFYARFQEYLGEKIEVCPIQYPGHDTRAREPLIHTAEELAEAMLEGIIPLTEDLPYAVFGHSLGAIMAYETVKQIQEYELDLPKQLFLSAAGVKFIQPPVPVSRQDDATLADTMLHFGGFDAEEVLHTEVFGEFYAKVIRNDFGIIENYEIDPAFKLDVPIRVYSAEQDDNILIEDIRRWEEHTTQGISFRQYPGNHFYIKNKEREVCQDIKHILQNENN